MKFAGDANRGKEGIPGLWRRMQAGGPTGIIGQVGEATPAGYEARGRSRPSSGGPGLRRNDLLQNGGRPMHPVFFS
jgi:hypothetical protein